MQFVLVTRVSTELDKNIHFKLVFLFSGFFSRIKYKFCVSRFDSLWPGITLSNLLMMFMAVVDDMGSSYVKCWLPFYLLLRCLSFSYIFLYLILFNLFDRYCAVSLWERTCWRWHDLSAPGRFDRDVDNEKLWRCLWLYWE